MRHLDIYIGKYIDQVDTQIPVEHIVLDQCGNFERYVEPGEPNLPASTNWSFVLDNLDYNGDQRYPLTWWENQARTQAEGAIQPLQIYIEARVLGHVQFRGIVQGIRYTKFQARCHVNCGDMLNFLRQSKKPMLKSFEFDTRCRSARDPGEIPGTLIPYGGNDLPIARSIDGQDIDHKSLVFLLSEGEALNVPNTSEIARHLGWDNLNYTNYREIVRSAWVQIEEITLLTRVRFFQRKPTTGTPANDIFIEVWHNHDDVITHGSGADEVTIIPRGQYLDREGNRLDLQGDPNKRVTLTLHEPNLGNDTTAVVHIDDTQLDEDFIFGVPFIDNGTHIQITSAAYSFFDVVQATIDVVTREIESVHATGSILSFFDTTYYVEKWNHAFWADILMYGWADATVAEAIVRMAHQVSAYLYTTRMGVIAIHSRSAHHNPPGPETTITVKQDEPLDGENRGGGWGTYETEVPQDILEVNNQSSDSRQTFYVNEDGQVSGPSLRNRSVQTDNYRTHDLGVPASNDPVPQKILRYSPGNANWPHTPKLDGFIPTVLILLQQIAKSMAYPTTTTKKRLGLDLLNIPVDCGQYLIDNDFVRWWMRRLTTNPKTLTAETEVQRIDPVSTPPTPPDEFLARYLAFEEYLHDEVTNADFEMGQADGAQLVYESTESWEDEFKPSINNLIIDHTGAMRLYYELRVPFDDRRAIAVMQSVDNGQTWQKIRENKNPGIINDPDSNLIYVEPPPGGAIDEIELFSVYHDPDAPASERYKAVGMWNNFSETFVWRGPESSDGLEFFDPVVVIDDLSGDNFPSSIFYDPQQSLWVIMGRTRGPDAPDVGPPTPYSGRREPIISTSNDWDDSTYDNTGLSMIDPATEYGYNDDADQPSFWDSFTDGCGDGWDPDDQLLSQIRPDFYMGNITYYHGIYMGVFPIFFRSDSRVARSDLGRTTGPIYPVFGVTRNPFSAGNWVLPDNNHPAVDLSPYTRVDTDDCNTAEGISEVGQIYSGFTFVNTNGMIFISTLNRVQNHYDIINTSLPDDRKIYVQTMREDRFGYLSHLDVPENEATWRTIPVDIPAGTQGLYVNGKVTILRAEILDTSNNVIPGFSRADCKLASGDSVSIPIEWENESIQSIAGNTVKIKFYWALGEIISLKFG